MSSVSFEAFQAWQAAQAKEAAKGKGKDSPKGKGKGKRPSQDPALAILEEWAGERFGAFPTTLDITTTWFLRVDATGAPVRYEAAGIGSLPVLALTRAGEVLRDRTGKPRCALRLDTLIGCGLYSDHSIEE